jgi:hypothetical protein
LIESIETEDYNKFKSLQSPPQDVLSILDGSPPPDPDDALFESLSSGHPRIFPCDRTQPLVLAQNLRDSLADIHAKYPDYTFSRDTDNADAIREELASWIHVFREGVRQVAAHSKSLALLLDTVWERFIDFSRTLLAEIQRHCTELDTTDVGPSVNFDSISCKGTPDEPLKPEFLKLHHVLTHASISPNDRQLLAESLRDMESRVNRNASAEEQLRYCKREFEALETSHKTLLLEHFDLEQQKLLSDRKVNDLMGVTSALRQVITSNERVTALSHSTHVTTPTRGLGSVPIDVMRIWSQLSQFCHNLLNGELVHIDLRHYFPADLSSPPEIPLFTMTRPTFSDEDLHFTVFFTEIRRSFDEKTLFSSLEGQIRDFLLLAAERYVKQFALFRAEQSAIAAEAIRKLDEFRAASGDPTLFLRLLLLNPECLRVPKSPQPDIHVTIEAIYRHAATQPVEKSAAQTVLRYFESRGNLGLIPFIAQICKYTRNDYEVSLFRQFLLQTLPVSAFLFYADLRFRCSEIPAFGKDQRMALLPTCFGHCGYSTLPKVKRQLWESTYNEMVKFPTFCLALYVFCVEKIEVEIVGKWQGGVEATMGHWLTLPSEEMFQSVEFMKTIAESGKPEARDLAVFLFRRKLSFEHILAEFDLADSLVLLGFENFGKKPSKKEKKSSAATAKMEPTDPG